MLVLMLIFKRIIWRLVLRGLR